MMKRRKILLMSGGVTATSILATKAQGKSPQQIMPGENVVIADDLSGYYVRPEGNKKFSVVIVFMEAFGLNDNIRSVCDRFAKAGYAAIAPDFYQGEVFPYSNIQDARAKLKTLKDEVVMEQVGKTLEFLGTRQEINSQNIGLIGFCMGGRLAFLANCVYGAKIKGAVSFYGAAIAANEANSAKLGRKPLLDQVPNMQAPIMLVYGAEDQMITPDEHERIALALSTNKKRYILNVFPNAGHGFLNDGRDNYVESAAEEAWEMTFNFFYRNIG